MTGNGELPNLVIAILRCVHCSVVPTIHNTTGNNTKSSILEDCFPFMGDISNRSKAVSLGDVLEPMAYRYSTAEGIQTQSPTAYPGKVAVSLASRLQERSRFLYVTLLCYLENDFIECFVCMYLSIVYSIYIHSASLYIDTWISNRSPMKTRISPRWDK